MATLADRVLKIRKASGLSQAAFAEQLNLSQNFIWMVEKGQREPSDRTISDICREFNVNEQWLRTGQGNMFLPKTRAQEIGEIVQNAATRDPEESMKFFTELLGDMTDAEIAIMYEVFRRHFPK